MSQQEIRREKKQEIRRYLVTKTPLTQTELENLVTNFENGLWERLGTELEQYRKFDVKTLDVVIGQQLKSAQRGLLRTQRGLLLVKQSASQTTRRREDKRKAIQALFSTKDLPKTVSLDQWARFVENKLWQKKTSMEEYDDPRFLKDIILDLTASTEWIHFVTRPRRRQMETSQNDRLKTLLISCLTKNYDQRLFMTLLKRYTGDINELFLLAVEHDIASAVRILVLDERLDPDSPEVIKGTRLYRTLPSVVAFIKKGDSSRETILRMRILSLFLHEPFEIPPDLSVQDHYGLYLSILTNVQIRDQNSGEDRQQRNKKRLIALLVQHASLARLRASDPQEVRNVAARVEILREVFLRRILQAISDQFGNDGDEIIRMLSLFPKGVNEALPDGMTPLHTAVLKNRFHLVRLLLRHGADPRARNTRGETPLHLALQYKTVSHIITALMSDRNATEIMETCLEVLDKDPSRLLIYEDILKIADTLEDISEDLADLMIRVTTEKIDDLKYAFLPVFARAGMKKKVKLLLGRGATAEPTGSPEMISFMTKEIQRIQKEKKKAQQQRKRKQQQQQHKRMTEKMDERQVQIFKEEDDLVKLESEVATELGIYDAAAFGIGNPPVIRVEAPDAEELLPAEKEHLESMPRVVGHQLNGLYRSYLQLDSKDNRRELVSQIRKHIPKIKTYSIVVAPDKLHKYRDESGKLTRRLRDTSEVPDQILEEHRRRENWHDIVSTCKKEMITGSKSIADYKDFLEDILTNLDTIRYQQRQQRQKTTIPIRWTDDEAFMRRRQTLFSNVIKPVITDIHNHVQEGSVVFAVDTINVLRGRDIVLRGTDYRDAAFQEIFDTSFAEHAASIADELAGGTIIWVRPRVGQREDIVVHGIGTRQVFVDVAVRLQSRKKKKKGGDDARELRFTRSVDDFFLLCLVAVYEDSTDNEIHGTRLVLVSDDKFRDWSQDVIGYDAAWEKQGQRVQKRAKKMADDKK